MPCLLSPSYLQQICPTPEEGGPDNTIQANQARPPPTPQQESFIIRDIGGDNKNFTENQSGRRREKKQRHNTLESRTAVGIIRSSINVPFTSRPSLCLATLFAVSFLLSSTAVSLLLLHLLLLPPVPAFPRPDFLSVVLSPPPSPTPLGTTHGGIVGAAYSAVRHSCPTSP